MGILNGLNRQTLSTRSWSDTANQIDTTAASVASNFSDAFVSSINGTKGAWSSLADTIVQDLERIAVQLALSPLLKLAGSSSDSGGLVGLLGKLGASVAPSIFGAASTALPTAGMSAGEVAFVNAAGHHKGGMVGLEPTFTRQLPASLFHDAPRYHTGGLAGDEVPAVLQRGEGVFTAGQMAAIGSQGDAVQAMSEAIAAMSATRMRVPSNLTSNSPSNYSYSSSTPSNAGGGSSSPGAGNASPITLNFHNQTGTAQTAVTSSPKFDGERMIIDIVTKHVNQPGALRDAVRK